MIARAAEGSVRDALSLLDQAIAHGAGLGRRRDRRRGSAARCSASPTRRASSICSRRRCRARSPRRSAILEDQYNGGADPAQVLLELAEFTHLVTRLKLAPDTAQSAALTPEEKAAATSAAPNACRFPR